MLVSCDSNRGIYSNSDEDHTAGTIRPQGINKASKTYRNTVTISRERWWSKTLQAMEKQWKLPSLISPTFERVRELVQNFWGSCSKTRKFVGLHFSKTDKMLGLIGSKVWSTTNFVQQHLKAALHLSTPDIIVIIIIIIFIIIIIIIKTAFS